MMGLDQISSRLLGTLTDENHLTWATFTDVSRDPFDEVLSALVRPTDRAEMTVDTNVVKSGILRILEEQFVISPQVRSLVGQLTLHADNPGQLIGVMGDPNFPGVADACLQAGMYGEIVYHIEDRTPA